MAAALLPPLALQNRPPPPPPPPPPPSLPKLCNKHIAFTTPSNYAPRLAALLRRQGADPLWCPTISVEPTPLTKLTLKSYLQRPGNSQSRATTPVAPLQQFSAIAFTSRAGIAAFSDAAAEISENPLADDGEPFIVAALGHDAELLGSGFRLLEMSPRVRVFVPSEPTPLGLARELGDGLGRRILCPVPRVVDLEEPPVVPEFLDALARRNWVPARAEAYVTRWIRGGCAAALVGERLVDAIVFTSLAEVEGLLKGLREELGVDWQAAKEELWPGIVVAAHGPVTAAGAARLGVAVDVVSSRFDSFQGVVDALALALGMPACG